MPRLKVQLIMRNQTIQLHMQRQQEPNNNSRLVTQVVFTEDTEVKLQDKLNKFLILDQHLLTLIKVFSHSQLLHDQNQHRHSQI